ncbi:DoxX family protein [Leptospira sp. GIMC2001]|uniref:DoxX family protein n=1 Tax=Leptospira sp. GIMC2001 TaxID=1513297 RepID=UPI00234948F6|nr:DoxX family protein [Leptospira sp. GIMC2001]WCL49127.1 DoxX family protein [Leptospira sp. GIMC2001]
MENFTKPLKIATLVVRILLGFIFTASSIVVLFDLVPQPELTGTMKTFNDGIKASGYLMPLVKITELVCGISLLVGRFVPLSLIVIAPVTVNILMVHIFIDTEGLPIAVLLTLGNLFLAYVYREKYKGLFDSK